MEREGGFALLITVTLIAFIVVLLIGLAAYTRVETAIAGNTQRQAQARENALFALNIALGQLQKYAGPDQRVTATAESFTPAPAAEGEEPISVNAQKIRYTGVWDATTTDKEPLAWLASGIETGTKEDVSQAIPSAQRAILIGSRTDGSAAANNTTAALQNITANGVPGVRPNAPPAVIGRYAWWVGDQGVKAPVAVPDAVSAVEYAPYDLPDMRARIAQQIGRGAGAVHDGTPAFEPRDDNNSALVGNGRVLAANQLALLRRPDSTTQVGASLLQQNFHAWSPNNFAVLANTKQGGLRQDLSLNPSLLGEAFAAWANYASYMESFTPAVATETPLDSGAGGPGAPAPVEPTPAAAPPILPAYGPDPALPDPLRRRYRMTPHQLNVQVGGSHQVAPILSYFLMTFNVRVAPTVGNNPSSTEQPLEVRARWMISLWNPYTSALVPEELRVEVSGLPTEVKVVNETAGGSVAATISLRDAFGSPMPISLPWKSTDADGGLPSDRQSWLPGRVYTWRSHELAKTAATPAAGYSSEFYSQTLDHGGQGVVRAEKTGVEIDGDDVCHLEVSGSGVNDPGELLVTVHAVRPDGDVVIGRFRTPSFVDGFTTESQAIGQFGYQFSYVFRLAESIDTPDAPATWLATTGRDFRRRSPPPEIFVFAENGNDPAQYPNYDTILKPDRLLSRRTDSWSYNEDVPVFELPRSPLLSLGVLQHFRLVGQRPFMIGNSWGAGFRLNDIALGELFDRFFFSGLVPGVTPPTNATGDLILPNPLLKPLRRQNGAKLTIDDLRALMSPPVPTDPDGNPLPAPEPSSWSSKYFLQGGAFNVNSLDPTAWVAVLRSTRMVGSQTFSYVDTTVETGSGQDTGAAVPPSEDARFFRFSQSAQETFKAEPDMADPEGSPARTDLFRKGMRTLKTDQVRALAEKIVGFIKIKHAAEGPFRSLEEFLAPSPLFAGPQGVTAPPRSVLEAAIADSDINSSIPEFSSQWLTQADIMTALAPLLFPRSDTFVIRAYGEAVNPAKLNADGTVPGSAVEGRAWCEALVQRIPEYFDPSIPPEALPSALEPTVDPDNPADAPASTPAQALNKLNGRRFKVISFRWLTRSDI